MVTLTDITVKAQHSIFGLHMRSQIADERTRLLHRLDCVLLEQKPVPDDANLNAELKALYTEIRDLNEKLDYADRTITSYMAPPFISSPQPQRPSPTPTLFSALPPVTPTLKHPLHQPASTDGFSATTREEIVTEDDEETMAVAHSVVPKDTKMAVCLPLSGLVLVSDGTFSVLKTVHMISALGVYIFLMLLLALIFWTTCTLCYILLLRSSVLIPHLFCFHSLFYLLLVLVLISPVLATLPALSLSIYALNTNGLGHLLKVHAINTVI